MSTRDESERLEDLWVCRGNEIVTEAGDPIATCLRKEHAVTIVWLHNSEVRRIRNIEERKEAERKAWDRMF